MVLDYDTVQFFLRKPQITAVELTRDQNGHCAHPAVPWEELDEYPVAPFFLAWGYEFCAEYMQNELNEDDAVMLAYDEGNGSFLGWEPKAVDGWILISMLDTDDGPAAWFVRPDARLRRNG